MAEITTVLVPFLSPFLKSVTALESLLFLRIYLRSISYLQLYCQKLKNKVCVISK